LGGNNIKKIINMKLISYSNDLKVNDGNKILLTLTFIFVKGRDYRLNGLNYLRNYERLMISIR
jgi:hypothetical protein